MGWRELSESCPDPAGDERLFKHGGQVGLVRRQSAISIESFRVDAAVLQVSTKGEERLGEQQVGLGQIARGRAAADLLHEAAEEIGPVVRRVEPLVASGGKRGEEVVRGGQ